MLGIPWDYLRRLKDENFSIFDLLSHRGEEVRHIRKQFLTYNRARSELSFKPLKDRLAPPSGEKIDIKAEKKSEIFKPP